MKEIVVKVEVPEEFGKELEKSLKQEVERCVKRVLISRWLDEVMKGAKNLSEEEIIELSREFKKREFEKLKQLGFV